MTENPELPTAWAEGEPSQAVAESPYGYAPQGSTEPQAESPTPDASVPAAEPAAPPQYLPPQAQYVPPSDATYPQPQPNPQFGYGPGPQPGQPMPAHAPVYGPGPGYPPVALPAGPPVQAPHMPAPNPYGPPPQAPQAAGAPRGGWRQSLQSIASGFVTFGGTRKKEEIAQLANRVRQPIRNDFRLAVLSLKGGVGKTTVTVGLGSVLASLRGDRVIAVDANPDLGTLARRIPAQTASTVRDLLQDPHLERYMDVRKHTSQAPSRLEVLASERDPAISEAFSEDEYLRVIGILENHYNMILTDCGTGLVHSAMAGVMKSATSLVLVTSAALDGAQSAVATLDWLVAHGYEQIARETVVVIAASKGKNSPVDVNMLREYFLGRTRAVQIIPYDQHLAIGGFIDLDEMQPATRSAFLELAATLVEPFVVQPPQPGFAGPFGGMTPPPRPAHMQ